MTQWFTSDLHFGHKNVLKHCSSTRPFSTIEEMNEHIISTWNSQVKPRQMVWVLGDFSFYGIDRTRQILSRLNGDIRIVRGNHDKYAKQLISMGFSNVYENHMIELVNHFYVNLSHFPYHPGHTATPDYDTRYAGPKPIRLLLRGQCCPAQRVPMLENTGMELAIFQSSATRA